MTQPTLQECSLEVQDRVALLTFQRHDVRNALSGTALIDDLFATVRWVNHTSEVSVLIITGDGSAFSSGGNIKDMEKGEGLFGGETLEIQEKYRHLIHQLPHMMERCDVPTIAAVNGAAMGVGFDLACMCDLRLASTRAKVGSVFINLGLIPGDGGAFFLPRVVGAQRAAEMILTGRVLNAEEAFEAGVFLEVVEPETLVPAAKALAARIASRSPQAIRLAKRLLKAGARSDLQSVLDLSAGYNAMLHQTDAHKEAVQSLLEQTRQRRAAREQTS